MATITVPDFESWRAPFWDFGRVVRGENGEILRIVERKDASEEELEITEGSPSFFCFNAAWLWENLAKIKNENVQSEYYLPDLVHIAISSGAKVELVPVDAREAVGVNTKDQLELADTISKE